MNEQALIAERDEYKRLYEANQLACESMARQLQEERAEKEQAWRHADTLRRDLRMSQETMKFWRAECQKMIADRTYVTA